MKQQVPLVLSNKTKAFIPGREDGKIKDPLSVFSSSRHKTKTSI